jgi:NAD(P)-dependent dehydrogenase (short-subunit alcohol dehydrogenase family)
MTGANIGIGLAMSQSLLEWGDRVVALDLSLENLDQGKPNLLACKIGSKEPYLTPDFISALGIFGNQHFPLAKGRFLARMATRAPE